MLIPANVQRPGGNCYKNGQTIPKGNLAARFSCTEVYTMKRKINEKHSIQFNYRGTPEAIRSGANASFLISGSHIVKARRGQRKRIINYQQLKRKRETEPGSGYL